MINEIKQDAQSRMEKSVESLKTLSRRSVPVAPTPASWMA